MTYYMYLIQTFIIRCTVSEILAEIDHKGPRSCIQEIKKSYQNAFEKIGKTAKFDPFRTFRNDL